MHHAFKFLYLISKVRGAKVVVRWFSHEVSDLQPVLQLLQKQDIKDHEVCSCSIVEVECTLNSMSNMHNHHIVSSEYSDLH